MPEHTPVKRLERHHAQIAAVRLLAQHNDWLLRDPSLGAKPLDQRQPDQYSAHYLCSWLIAPFVFSSFSRNQEGDLTLTVTMKA